MKTLDTGDEKVKKICDMLRQDTLKPAQDEAEAIVAKAHEEAKRIKEEAEKHAQSLLEQAKGEIEQQKKVFDTSIAMAGKQAIETLRQRIEKEMLSRGIQGILQEAFSLEQSVAKLMEALITSVEKSGMSGSLAAELPKHLQTSEVLKGILNKAGVALKDGVSLRDGVRLQIVDSNLTLDFSEEAVGSLLFQFIREDFREKVFAKNVDA